MRICFSALQIGPGMTGVGVYARELLRALAAGNGFGKHWIVVCPHPEALSFLSGQSAFSVVSVSLLRDDPWGRMWATHTALPMLAQKHGADVVFTPNFVAPLWGNFSRVTIVHDLTFDRLPETTPRAKQLYYRWLVRHTVKKSKRVLVTTRTIGEELAHFEPSAAGRIRRIGGGVPRAFLANDGRRSSPGAHARDGFLFVGTLEPRKNLERILAAHAQLCRQDPSTPVLRIIGGKGWRDGSILQALEDHPNRDKVERLGFTGPDDLLRAYDRSLALLFPSLYEGLGLPALEAMARACPVLTSQRIATAEVTGDAALLVDPHDVGSIARGMARLASDGALRDRLREKGLQRVREFRFEECAARVAAVLDEAGVAKTQER